MKLDEGGMTESTAARGMECGKGVSRVLREDNRFRMGTHNPIISLEEPSSGGEKGRTAAIIVLAAFVAR